jgi:prepilin-type N-terminal cleavage/methylation domain-containing protein
VQWWSNEVVNLPVRGPRIVEEEAAVRRRYGFTLIELLVVVAIIALLVAVLLPSLGRAKQRANVAKCTANVRAIGQALNIYFTDWQRLMPYYNVGSSFWTNTLAPYGAGDKVRACPNALSIGASQQGSSTTMWHGFSGATDAGAYGLNGWVYTPPGQFAAQYASSGVGWTFPVSRDNSLVPLAADASWPDGWPMPTDQPPTSLAALETGAGSANDNYMRRFCINRHQMTVNVSFFDNHAENVPLRKLWTLKWNANWVAPTSLPNLPTH